MRLATLHQLLPRRAAGRRFGAPAMTYLARRVIVAVVALPLALGFRHGFSASRRRQAHPAIVAGALADIFGGSDYQVSGPAGAITMILVPIVAKYSPGGDPHRQLPRRHHLARARGGPGPSTSIRCVPVPVVRGIHPGIAAVISSSSATALGVDATPIGPPFAAWQAFRRLRPHPHWTSILLAVGVAATIVIAGRSATHHAVSLIRGHRATLVAGPVKTPRGHHRGAAHNAARSLARTPAASPTVPTLAHLRHQRSPRSVALESCCCPPRSPTASRKADATIPTADLGQGIANLATPLFGGSSPRPRRSPARGATCAAGARSRLAALHRHGDVLSADHARRHAGSSAHIPLAALAGVLLATAIADGRDGPP